MTKHKSLQVIFVFSVLGVMFSGYLSFQELFSGSCNLGYVTCGATTGLIMGLPACVYGLIMYTILLFTSVVGIKAKK